LLIYKIQPTDKNSNFNIIGPGPYFGTSLLSRHVAGPACSRRATHTCHCCSHATCSLCSAACPCVCHRVDVGMRRPYETPPHCPTIKAIPRGAVPLFASPFYPSMLPKKSARSFVAASHFFVARFENPRCQPEPQFHCHLDPTPVRATPECIIPFSFGSKSPLTSLGSFSSYGVMPGCRRPLRDHHPL
jgi:hypothetical protein